MGVKPTGTTRAPASVSVVVLNGSGGVKGVAGATTDKIKAKGYKTLEPGNAAPVDKTTVYYTAGYQADANAVAGVLGLARDLCVRGTRQPTSGEHGRQRDRGARQGHPAGHLTRPGWTTGRRRSSRSGRRRTAAS